MKNTAKRTMAAFLALLMLVLAVPMTGIFTLAADEAAADTIPSKLLISNDYNGEKVGREAGTDAVYAADESGDVHVQFKPASAGLNVALIHSGNESYRELRDNDGDSAIMTLSFSLTPETETFPGMRLQFRTKDGGSTQATMKLMVVAADGFMKFAHNQILGPKVEVGETYDIVMVVHVVNTSDSTSTVTVTPYVNGFCYGTKSTAGAAVVVNKGDVNKAIERIHFSVNAGGGNGTQTMQLDDTRVYLGYDPVTVPEIENLSGASIRLDDTAETSGLRFSFRMTREKYDAILAAGGEIGAMIVPTDWLESGKLSALTHEAIALLSADDQEKVIDEKVIGLSAESTEEYGYFNVSIVNMLAKNFAREFTAIAYVKNSDGSYTYSHISDSRSVIEVAHKYAASDEYANASAEKKAVADGYRSKVVYLETDGATLKISDTYACAYTLTYENNTITLSGAGVSGISSIVLDGVVYTGGWRVLEGAEVETITAPYTVPSAE